jgi:hypothetical protein
MSKSPPCLFFGNCTSTNHTALVTERITVNVTEDISTREIDELVYTDDPKDVECPDNYDAEEECNYPDNDQANGSCKGKLNVYNVIRIE